MIVGVDIGGHHIAAAAVNNGTHALLPNSYRHHPAAPDAGCSTLIAAWAATIDAVVEQTGIASVKGIGVAMPGPFDYHTGIGYFSTNGKFRSLNGVNVAALLRKAARHPRPIRFLNDATAFTVGCVAMDAVGKGGRVLGVTLGTGLGSAFLEDGIPVIAHPHVPDHGCLWHLPYRNGIADDYISARWIMRQAGTRVTGDFADVAAVAQAARAGSTEAVAVFADYGANLGAILAPWLDRFGVDAIMLGGRICGAFDLFERDLKGTLAANGLAPSLTIHQNTEDAAIVGAAATFDPGFWERARHRLPTR